MEISAFIVLLINNPSATIPLLYLRLDDIPNAGSHWGFLRSTYDFGFALFENAFEEKQAKLD